MNAQTAAVIDFQAPRAYQPFTARPVKSSLNGFRIRFKVRVLQEVESKLTLQLLAYVNCYKETDCSTAKMRYHCMAIGLLDALVLANSIDLSERARAIRLFMEQADLFDDRQAA